MYDVEASRYCFAGRHCIKLQQKLCNKNRSLSPSEWLFSGMYLCRLPNVTLGYRTSGALRARKSLALKQHRHRARENLQFTVACLFGKWRWSYRSRHWGYGKCFLCSCKLHVVAFSRLFGGKWKDVTRSACK